MSEGVTIRGKDLLVGDTIDIWWSPGRDTITALRPYDGPLNYCFAPDGAQIASFALCKVGMTIENAGQYMLLSRAAGPMPGKRLPPMVDYTEAYADDLFCPAPLF